MKFGTLIKRIGMAVALLIVLSGAIVAALLGTGPGRSFTAQTLSNILSNDQQTIEISELQSVLGGALKLKSLSLTDAEGEFARLENVAVRYDTVALLTGRVIVDSATIESLTLSRLPKSNNVSAPTAPSLPQQLLPSPLRELKIGRFDIGQINIGAEIAGSEKSYTLSGNVFADNKPMQVRGALDLSEVGENGTDLQANWNVSPSDDRFTLELLLAEARGGLITHLLNIPSAPKLDVALKGGGPLSDWRTQLQIQLDDRVVTSGEVTLGLKDQTQVLSGNLNGQLAPFLPKSLLPIVAGETNLVFAAQRDENGDFFIEQAELKSALASAQLAGRYQPSNGTVDLSGQALIGDEDQVITFARVEGQETQLGRTKVSGALKGPLVDAQMQIEAVIDLFEEAATGFSDLDISMSSQSINLQNQTGEVRVAATAQNISSGQAELDKLLSGAIALNAIAVRDGDVVSINGATIKGNNIEGKISGTYDFVRGTGSVLANSTVENLGNSAMGQALGFAEAQIQLDAELLQPFSINIAQANVRSRNLNAQISGTLAPDNLSLNGDIKFADLSYFHRDMVGALNAQSQIGGSLLDPTILLTAAGEKVSIANNPVEEPKLKLSGSPLKRLELQATGQYQSAPIEANAVYNVAEDGSKSVTDLLVVAPGLNANGNMRISDVGLFDGAVDFAVADFSQLGGLLMQPNLAGEARGKIAFAVQEGKQFVAVDAVAQRFNSSGVSMTNAALVGSVNNLFGELEPEIALTADRVSFGAESLSKINANVAASEGNWPIVLHATYGGKPVEVRAVAQQTATGFDVSVDKADLNYKGISAALGQSATVKMSKGTIDVAAPRISVAGGTASINGQIADDLNLTVKLNGLSAAAIDQFAQTGQGLSGSISGEARVRGTAANPSVGFNLNGSALSVAAARNAGLSALQLNGSGTFANNSVTGRYNFVGGGLSLGIDGGVNLASNSINLRMSGDAPFAYFAQLLTRSGIVLSGNGKINASVTGPLSSPRINGTLTTEDARFTEIASRLRITNIAATISLDGDQAQISRLNGRLGSQGSVSASGSVSLRAADKMNANIELRVRNGEYDDGNIISATFDADLALTGRLAETGQLRGQINLARTDITVPETLANVVSPVAVTHKNASAEVNAQANALQTGTNGGGGGPSMNLDVTVNAPNRIFVRGRGLDAELGGRFVIGGTTARPIASGALNLIRGRMSILTKRFDFDFGRLLFTGPLMPTLNFAATTRENGSTYTIFVKGEASSPEFSFGATPSVPQDQIVAKLFFGRNLAELSPLQLVQLANAIAELNGSNSGPGLLDRLRSVAGLDDVDIKTNEQGETTVGVGAYLNDRTYVNVEKGAGAGSGKVTIDLNITDNITARGETSEDGNTKAGVFFEQDY